MPFIAIFGPVLKAGRLAALVALGLVVAGKALAAPPTATPKVIEALDNIRNLTRPQQDGYATTWQGNKFVQCHALSDQSLSCEAAGAMMQPSLEDVLTPERKQRLASLGWRLDPKFGAYVQVFPPTLGLDQVADRILTVLHQAYDADLTHIEVQTRWVGHQACPPRRGPGQIQAGLVDDDPLMSPTAVHGCAFSDSANPTTASAPAAAPAPPAPAPSVLVVDVPETSDPVVVEDTAVIREPHGRRRERHPRISSSHRESRGARRSRSGGHGSHHK
jgi:hypothetical protein